MLCDKELCDRLGADLEFPVLTDAGLVQWFGLCLAAAIQTSIDIGMLSYIVGSLPARHRSQGRTLTPPSEPWRIIFSRTTAGHRTNNQETHTGCDDVYPQ